MALRFLQHLTRRKPSEPRQPIEAKDEYPADYQYCPRCGERTVVTRCGIAFDAHTGARLKERVEVWCKNDDFCTPGALQVYSLYPDGRRVYLKI